jgi:hypothetical protein
MLCNIIYVVYNNMTCAYKLIFDVLRYIQYINDLTVVLCYGYLC